MSKIFVFGTARGDVKGRDDERGTVAVKAPTLPAARAVFVKAKGGKDRRVDVVRLPRANEHVDEAVHAPDLALDKNGNVVALGDVAVHELPEGKPDTAGDIASVFANLDAGVAPVKRATRAAKAKPAKRRASKASAAKAAE